MAIFIFGDHNVTLLEVGELHDLQDDLESNDQQEMVTPEGKLIKTFVVFLLAWQAFAKTSNNALVLLLKFISGFILAIANALNARALVEFARHLPTTLYHLKKAQMKDTFEKYIMCPKV